MPPAGSPPPTAGRAPSSASGPPAPTPPVEGEGEVRYLGDGRWAARRGDREVTGIVGLEEATETAVELMREAA